MYFFFSMVYFNFASQKTRGANDHDACVGYCPMLTISDINGDMNDGDCRERVYHSTRQGDVSTLPTHLTYLTISHNFTHTHKHTQLIIISVICLIEVV